jgi:ABC-type taurine transport system substrate-binding protein
MNTTMPIKQRGLTLGGFIAGAFVFVIVAITLLKLVPAYVQNAQINSIFRDIAHDPDMQKAAPHDIEKAFDRRASVDAITAITSGDIDISMAGDTPILSASYVVKVPLVGNISLYLEFNPSSAGK